MAITKATVRNDQLELQRRGFINVNLTALTTAAVPDVEVGSAFEVGGSIYEIDTADETPAGWAGIANDTQSYIYFDSSAETLNFTDTAPSYSAAKGGWYSGDDRYLARVYKDASGNADGKEVYAQESETTPYKPSTRIPFSTIETITTGSGTWSVPEQVYAVKVIVTGGGGAGAFETGIGDGGGDTTFGTLTGSGGSVGRLGSDAEGGDGGTASGGDINITGGDGGIGEATSNSEASGGGNGGGGSSYWGGGAQPGVKFSAARNGQAIGSGGGGKTADEGGGGAGGTAIAILSVSPGDTYSYSVGSGGAADASGGGDGADGIIYLEY